MGEGLKFSMTSRGVRMEDWLGIDGGRREMELIVIGREMCMRQWVGKRRSHSEAGLIMTGRDVHMQH